MNFSIPEYYLSQSIITDPNGYSELYKSLPDTIPAIIDVIHGLFLHVFWAKAHGVKLNKYQKEHVQSRHIRNILELITEMDNSPLENNRPYEKRFYGNCRDYAVFLTSVLRFKGIPARARCGFAKYFSPGKYEDHWITEYWDKRKKKWIRVDPQLDKLQQKKLNISFDPLDVPENEFVSGAKAWKLCRDENKNPNDFGIFDMHGLWFVRGNLIRDLASLNKVELLPWDGWGLIDKVEKELTENDYKLLDQVANLVVKNDKELYSIYNNNSKLKVHKKIKSYTNRGEIEVSIF